MGVISIGWFWSHGRICFLAETIAGQRSALMCTCIARAISKSKAKQSKAKQSKAKLSKEAKQS